jgi:hypothetical protein
MAKAHITTKEGTKITIEGTPDEVAALAHKLGGGVRVDAPSGVGKKRRQKQEKVKATPVNLISSLIDGGFFRKPKDLAAVKIALEELGHGYPVTTLSPILLRLVRRRQLRRMRDKGRWFYTG